MISDWIRYLSVDKLFEYQTAPGALRISWKCSRGIVEVTIMISPLNSLTEQQVQNVETLKNQGYKVNAIAVTAKNNCAGRVYPW